MHWDTVLGVALPVTVGLFCFGALVIFDIFNNRKLLKEIQERVEGIGICGDSEPEETTEVSFGRAIPYTSPRGGPPEVPVSYARATRPSPPATAYPHELERLYTEQLQRYFQQRPASHRDPYPVDYQNQPPTYAPSADEGGYATSASNPNDVYASPNTQSWSNQIMAGNTTGQRQSLSGLPNSYYTNVVGPVGSEQ
jgi:hypothetical protein